MQGTASAYCSSSCLPSPVSVLGCTSPETTTAAHCQALFHCQHHRLTLCACLLRLSLFFLFFLHQVGTMIEVPRGALRAGDLAKTAEFFSFGTNDLTQMVRVPS